MSGSNQGCLAKDCQTVKISASDQAQFNLHVGNQGISAHQNQDNRWWTEARENVKGSYLDRFLKKVNEHTWRNVQEEALATYKDLTENPADEFYPQIKTGFDLYRGDCVPQEGFSAHSISKGGQSISVLEYKDRIQTIQAKPSVIIGQPGSGKTVFMKRIAKNLMLESRLNKFKQMWILRKLDNIFNRKEYDAVIYLNIKDIDYVDDVALAQVLFNQSVTGLTPNEAQYGLQAILERNIRTIIFFDGLDQATWTPSDNKKVDPWTKSNTATIFGNILTGHLLSDIPIVISSREHTVACLSVEMRPQFIGALAGFSEADAKTMYWQIMGDGADVEWDIMRQSNPGMMYMCLTPLFLIFYMITRKKDPDDPPDCASGVMIRIIHILLESDHTQNVANVINKLKQMAFQGTKEQRVVFTHEDLRTFDINYKDVSDVIIKVAGLNILGQNVLEGMYRFFFTHQTLQEVLSAICAVEMALNDFKTLVSTEFHKPYWSVVRNFACGILKNERVRCRISEEIINLSQREAKCEYLMENIEDNLKVNPPPAEKLDIFVALKEADALEILRNYATNLDFSNSPLTPSMINVLCSVMKHLESVPSLSLANCGLDDRLLEVLATSSNHLRIKIGSLDVRGNIEWTNILLWSKIFENMTISNCLMDVPRNPQNEKSTAPIRGIVEAINVNVENLDLGEWNKMCVSIEQLERLVKYGTKMMINELWIKTERRLEFNEDIWSKTFQRMAFTVDRCFIEAPLFHSLLSPIDEIDHVGGWISAAKAANVENVKQVVMISQGTNLLDFSDIISLNDSGLHCEILLRDIMLRLNPETYNLDAWRQSFLQTASPVVTIDICRLHCYNDFQADVLVEAAVALDVSNVNTILLASKRMEAVKITISNLASLTKPKFHGKIRRLNTVDCELFLPEDWRQLGIVARKFDVEWTALHQDCAFPPDLRPFADGYGSGKFQRIVILGLYENMDIYQSEYISTSGNFNDFMQIDLLNVRLPCDRLFEQPRDVGCFIRDYGFDEVVFFHCCMFRPNNIYYDINVSSFVDGLNGFKIKCLVVDDTLDKLAILEIVRRCNVEHLYTTVKEDEKDLRRHTMVTILSVDEFRQKIS